MWVSTVYSTVYSMPLPQGILLGILRGILRQILGGDFMWDSTGDSMIFSAKYTSGYL